MANLYFHLDFREIGPKGATIPSMHISLEKLLDEMHITNDCVNPTEIEYHANKMISELEKIKKRVC